MSARCWSINCSRSSTLATGGDRGGFESERISYEELNRRANRVAHHLLALGAIPDTRVALFAERSIDMVVGLLGILKAGAAYVPLDPTYPADRIAYMLADSAPMAVLTQTQLRELLPSSAASTLPVIALDDQHPLPSLDDSNPDPAAMGLDMHHLAYVIYTSGSTGMPKGVMNQHDGVANRLLWAQDEYDVESSDAFCKRLRSVSTSRFGNFSFLCWRCTIGHGAPTGAPGPRIPEQADTRRRHHHAAFRAFDAAAFIEQADPPLACHCVACCAAVKRCHIPCRADSLIACPGLNYITSMAQQKLR